ncbi:AAA domain-containing protein [Microcoleus sp. B9-D4]|uniref:AAA domain-containing protein n=1 Tax=Microcoleus sp. B9-D4 TaxID=2818711 RepID=UPI002FCFFE2A
MRVSDIQSGRIHTIEVERSDRTSFDGQEFLSIKNEVFLHRDEIGNDILLVHGSDIWNIQGKDQQNQTQLESILERNLPTLCWLLEIRPKQSPNQLSIKVHEFPDKLYIPNEMQFGVDEKIIEDIRTRHRGRSEPVDKIIEWLTHELILLPTSESPKARILIRTGKNYQDGLENSFQLCGNRITVDVRTDDSRLRVERVTKSRSPKDASQQRPLILLEAPMSFCDMSIAGTLRGSIQTELDALTRNADTYLSLWREYNELEETAIVQKANEVGWIAYSSEKMLASGDHRFHLEKKANLQERLQGLRDRSEFSLEASEREPDLSSLESVASGQKFFGQISDIDPQNLTLDIRPSNPDELLSPPPNGFLFFSLQGDRTRLNRRKRAEELIRTATCPMPQLGLILQDQKIPLSNYRQHKLLDKTVREAFQGSPTPRQKEALRVAINTPDIALIQGPPGTGKTKVITAIQTCLSEIEKNRNGTVSHRLLLTSYQHDAVENVAERTVIFGLPAVRVGGRSSRSDAPDNVDRWRIERIDALKAEGAELPETANLRKVQNLVTGYVLTPGNLQETAKLLEEIYNLTKIMISGELSDRLLEQSRTLTLGNSTNYSINNEARELAIQAIQSLRIEPISFLDDGPTAAYKTLRRLESLNLLSDDDRRLLEKAADWDNFEFPGEPPFLNDLANLQIRILDQLTPTAGDSITAPVANPDIESLLEQVREALTEQVRQSQSGVEAVVEEYLNDLRSDPNGVRQMLRNYTVVLAATCQQAVGREMESTTGNVNSVFETVIIDEAARANPLDLFIPMAKAERRIILVGDHRQLPHILEEDVERQLNSSNQTTQDALKKSLFERLFKQLQEWEKRDGIKRTVTLDTQYRMHPILGDFVSRTFYEYHGEPPIKAGRPETEFFHELPGYQDKIAAWINVPLNLGSETKGQSKSRPVEARRIAEELKRLIEHDSRLTFGVIAFYRAQVTELWQQLCKLELAEVTDDGNYQVASAWRETTNHDGKLVERLRIGTVDAFQGKEFDVVFLSVTRSNNIPATPDRPETYRRKYGFLLLENRLCVAMSRQQRLLIATGDLEMVRAEADLPESERQAIRELIAFYELCKTPDGKVF